MDLEHSAMSGLAVPQIGQRNTKEIIKAVGARVMAVIVVALTVKSKVPLPWEQQEIHKRKGTEMMVVLP